MSKRDELAKKIAAQIAKQTAEALNEESAAIKSNTGEFDENTDAIEKNTKAKEKNTKKRKSLTAKERQANKILEQTEQLNKQLNQLDSERFRLGNMLDVQMAKEIVAKNKALNAGRVNNIIIKQEASERKKLLGLLKEDIIARDKQSKKETKEEEIARVKQLNEFKKKSLEVMKEEALVKKQAIAQNQKEAKEQNALRTAREKNKETLRNLSVIAKNHNINLKMLTGSMDTVKRAIKGDVRAMGDLKRAMREATKQGTELNETLGVLSVRSLRNAKGGGAALSVLRSKLLLASFAIQQTAGRVMRLVDAYAQQERAEKSLATALESTNYASGQNIESLKEYASQLQQTTGITDELILESSALLATFVNIGGDTFKKAQSAILDVTIAMNQGNVTTETLKTSTIQLGKALNDPIKGISALSRVGIQFTDEQKETIKTLMESNEVSKAQAIILKELEVQFGGMGEAFRETTEGALMAFNSALGDSQERIGGLIAQSDAFKDFLNSMTNSVNSLKVSNIVQLAASITSIGALVALPAVARGGIQLVRLIKRFEGIGKLAVGVGRFVFNMSALGKAFTIITASGVLTYLLKVFNIFESFDERQADPIKTANDELERLNNLSLSQGEILDTLMQQRPVLTGQLIEFTDALEKEKKGKDISAKQDGSLIARNKILIEQGEEQLKLIRNQIQANEVAIGITERKIKVDQEALEEKKKSLGESIEVESDELKLAEKVQEMLKQTTTVQERQTQELYNYVDALIEEGHVSTELLELRETLYFRLIDLNDITIKVTESTEEASEAIKFFGKEFDFTSFKTELAANSINALANEILRLTNEGKSLRTLKLGEILGRIAIAMGSRALAGGFMGMLMPGGSFLQGAAQAVGIAFSDIQSQHNGGQVKKYHQGGLAQNEVPAILEQGEFVIRREAVNSVGLETLNRINQTGSTGSVNISFTGNVLSQDFIEDEAIPMIKEAVRRGADIGVS